MCQIQVLFSLKILGFFSFVYLNLSCVYHTFRCVGSQSRHTGSFSLWHTGCEVCGLSGSGAQPLCTGLVALQRVGSQFPDQEPNPRALILVIHRLSHFTFLCKSKLSSLKSTLYFPLVFVYTMFLPQINFEIGPEIMWSHRKRGSVTSAHLLSSCFLNAAYSSSPHLPNSK